MGFHATVMVCMVIGGSYSYVAFRAPSLVKGRRFCRVGFAGIAACWVAMGTAGARQLSGMSGGFGAMFDVAFILVLMGVGSTPWIPFVILAMREGVDKLGEWAMSDHKLKVRPMYSLAEAAEARGDLKGAEEAYRALADQHPTDQEPLRRLAEILTKRGDVDAAVQAMTVAMRREERPGESYLLAIRLAEIFADDAGNVSAAIRVLEDMLSACPDHAGAEFVTERLAAFRRRMG